MNLNFMMPALAKQEGENFYLEGVASTTDLDKHREQMSPSALQDMVSKKNVRLTNSHNDELDNHIGDLVESRLDGETFYTKFQIDKDDATAMRLWRKVHNGAHAGLSVGGIIKSTIPGEGNTKRIITGVDLEHVMLTLKPANPKTMVQAFAKTIDDMNAEDEEFFKDDVSPTERKAHATFTVMENGKPHGEFPIFDAKSAEAALHLIGKAPVDEQDKIREKACAILGNSHPACAAKKSQTPEVTNSMENSELNSAEVDTLVKTAEVFGKAGAAISAANRAKIQSVIDLLGQVINPDGAPVIGGAKIPEKMVDPVPGGPADVDGEANTDGVVNGDAQKSLKAEDITTLIKTAIAEALPELMKSERKSVVDAEALTKAESPAEAFAKANSLTDLRSLFGQYLSEQTNKA